MSLRQMLRPYIIDAIIPFRLLETTSTVRANHINDDNSHINDSSIGPLSQVYRRPPLPSPSTSIKAADNSTTSSFIQTTNASTTSNGTSSNSSAPFSWDSRVQGSVLAAFFYGYVITQIPGGYLTRRCGGKVVYAFGVVGSSLLALLSPIAATAGGWKALWAARFLQGVAQVIG